jgi:colicin import membrane protein
MKTKLPRYLAAACATLAFTCTVAFADDPKPEPAEKGPSKADLKKYDANQDGQLDETEAAQAKADKEAKREADKKARLEKYDTNKDGKVDKTEAEAEKADKEKAKAEKQAAKEAKKAEREAKKAERQH